MSAIRELQDAVRALCVARDEVRKILHTDDAAPALQAIAKVDGHIGTAISDIEQARLRAQQGMDWL